MKLLVATDKQHEGETKTDTKSTIIKMINQYSTDQANRFNTWKCIKHANSHTDNKADAKIKNAKTYIVLPLNCDNYSQYLNKICDADKKKK